MLFSIKRFLNQNKFLPSHLFVVLCFALIYMIMSTSHGTDEDKEHFSNFLILFTIQQLHILQ